MASTDDNCWEIKQITKSISIFLSLEKSAVTLSIKKGILYYGKITFTL